MGEFFQKFMTICIWIQGNIIANLCLYVKSVSERISVLLRSDSKLATPANNGVYRNFS